MYNFSELTKKVTYDKKRSILFNSILGKKDSRAMMFSNFKPFEFQADGLTFYSVEQRFQWLRLAQRPDFQKNIMKYGLEDNGHNVKHYSSRPNVKPVLNNDYEQLVKWMRECLRYKLQYCEGFKNELLKTGNASLVEYSTWGDDFWGAVGQKGNGKTLAGCNVTGKLLMELREELTQGEPTPEPIEDEDELVVDYLNSTPYLQQKEEEQMRTKLTTDYDLHRVNNLQNLYGDFIVKGAGTKHFNNYADALKHFNTIVSEATDPDTVYLLVHNGQPIHIVWFSHKPIDCDNLPF